MERSFVRKLGVAVVLTLALTLFAAIPVFASATWQDVIDAELLVYGGAHGPDATVTADGITITSTINWQGIGVNVTGLRELGPTGNISFTLVAPIGPISPGSNTMDQWDRFHIRFNASFDGGVGAGVAATDGGILNISANHVYRGTPGAMTPGFGTDGGHRIIPNHEPAFQGDNTLTWSIVGLTVDGVCILEIVDPAGNDNDENDNDDNGYGCEECEDSGDCCPECETLCEAGCDYENCTWCEVEEEHGCVCELCPECENPACDGCPENWSLFAPYWAWRLNGELNAEEATVFWTVTMPAWWEYWYWRGAGRFFPAEDYDEELVEEYWATWAAYRPFMLWRNWLVDNGCAPDCDDEDCEFAYCPQIAE
jgi:hypothetical protein